MDATLAATASADFSAYGLVPYHMLQPILIHISLQQSLGYTHRRMLTYPPTRPHRPRRCIPCPIASPNSSYWRFRKEAYGLRYFSSYWFSSQRLLVSHKPYIQQFYKWQSHTCKRIRNRSRRSHKHNKVYNMGKQYECLDYGLRGQADSLVRSAGTGPNIVIRC